MQVGHTRRTWLHYVLAAGGIGALLPPARAGEITPWPAREPVPALEATGLDDARWRLDALRGRAVMVNFWASWCEPCRAEMPTLQILADLYGSERLAVLALNFKESANVAARYVRTTGMALPVLLDPAGEIARRWSVKVFPTTIGIGTDGRPRWRVRGEMDWTSPEAGRLVEGLLGKPR
ncbi:MAG: TlpA family protein disulfide reductase [Burkholderiales bacterium]|nr:TlpA family protein disulfide reductase [Burkholderiales bacterium]